MVSDLYDGLLDALTEAIGVYDQTFTWDGNEYGCILDASAAVLTTSKALFSDGNYPEVGDVIRVAGKDRQIIRRAGSAMELVAGGLVETGATFVDDPTNPSIAIAYDGFIGK